jgi:hypothetical protein
MPKSRKRGGEKTHRKRVKLRNQNIQNQKNHMQKLWEEEMKKKLEEMNKSMSGDTENQEIDTSESMNISL